MTEDWAADVKKFVPDADDKVIAAIVRYCGIALRNRDSSLVSFTDPAETGRVRDNFLKKKLGLTQADDVLDKAIATVGERMKGSNFKNRVTVYYLLLEHFDLLHLLGGAKASGGASDAALAGAGAAALGAAAFASGTEAPAPKPEPEAAAWTAQPLAGGHGAAAKPKTGMGWWPWLLLALLALFLVWWLFLRTPGEPAATEPASAVAEATAPADPGFGDLSAAPAEGMAVVPTGAGVTAETRDGKPVVKVYFDTGNADVVPAFAGAAGGLKTYMDGHSGASLAVSGFNDKTGNAALNAELSKNRAQAVKAALVAAGIPDASVELVKPADTTDAASIAAEARRVEVVVR